VRNIRIVSDGTPKGTRLVDTESGEPVDALIKSVYWEITAENDARATVELVSVEADVEGQASFRYLSDEARNGES